MSVMIIMIMRMILVALYNQYVGVEEEGGNWDYPESGW